MKKPDPLIDMLVDPSSPKWGELWEEFGMTNEQRGELADSMDEEMDRRSKGRAPAARLLVFIASASKATMLVERLQHLYCKQPALGDLPDFATCLAYGMADADTLDSEEFLAYTSAMGYHYWRDSQDKEDLVEFLRMFWTLSDKVTHALAFECFSHVLRNTPDQTSVGASLPLKAEDDVSIYSNFDEDKRATTFLEEITWGKLRLVHSDHLTPSEGLILTGARTATILVSRQDEQQNENKVAAHLLTHILLGHVSLGRFGVWTEGDLPKTTQQRNTTLAHEGIEKEAEDAAKCLVLPLASDWHLNSKCLSLVHTFRKLGVPTEIVRLLLSLREQSGIPLQVLLQKQPFDIDDPVKLPDPKIGSNGVILDGNNHIYLVRDLFELNLIKDER